MLRRHGWRPRLRSLMVLIVVVAAVLGAVAESSKAQHRWALNREESREHVLRAQFYSRSAQRFEELAQIEREGLMTPGITVREAERSSEQTDSLRRAAAEYVRSAAAEERQARECLRRW